MKEFFKKNGKLHPPYIISFALFMLAILATGIKIYYGIWFVCLGATLEPLELPISDTLIIGLWSTAAGYLGVYYVWGRNTQHKTQPEKIPEIRSII